MPSFPFHETLALPAQTCCIYTNQVEPSVVCLSHVLLKPSGSAWLGTILPVPNDEGPLASFALSASLVAILAIKRPAPGPLLPSSSHQPLCPIWNVGLALPLGPVLCQMAWQPWRQEKGSLAERRLAARSSKEMTS